MIFVDGGLIATALQALRTGVGELLAADFGALESTSLAQLTAELEVERRRLEALDARLVAALDEQGTAGSYGRSSTADLLVTTLRVSPSEAAARVARAVETGPRRALTGEARPPLLPVVSAAMAEGAISAAHAKVIADCVDRIPSTIAAEAAPVAEQMLVEAARHEHPRALARTAVMLLARLDTDGQAPREDVDRRRDFRLVKRPDGSSRPVGLWSAELTAAWEAILDALSAPAAAVDGLRDERTAGQRRHDGMLDAAMRLLRSGSLPAGGGVPVTVLVRTTVAELESGVGVAQTGHDDLLPVARLLQLAGDAELVPVVFNEAGGALAFGRGRRLASRGQRLVLAARDGGCSFPNCDRPAAWTEVHHVRPWVEGGATDVDNMCLVCSFHHREFERMGWTVRMVAGVPEWIPPPWVDPDQRPRRNTVHHPPDLDFGPGSNFRDYALAAGP